MDTIIVSEVGSEHSGTEVQIRGFLYRADDGRWILSDQPGLKSCCVGSEAKIQGQVVVEGTEELKEGPRPVVLRGTLSFRPQYTKLSHPVLVTEPSSWLIPWMMILAFGIGSFFLYWRKKR